MKFALWMGVIGATISYVAGQLYLPRPSYLKEASNEEYNFGGGSYEVIKPSDYSAEKHTEAPRYRFPDRYKIRVVDEKKEAPKKATEDLKKPYQKAKTTEKITIVEETTTPKPARWRTLLSSAGNVGGRVIKYFSTVGARFRAEMKNLDISYPAARSAKPTTPSTSSTKSAKPATPSSNKPY